MAGTRKGAGLGAEDRLSLPLQAARTREELSRVIGDATQLRSALDAFEGLGAVRDAVRARQALGAL